MQTRRSLCIYIYRYLCVCVFVCLYFDKCHTHTHIYIYADMNAFHRIFCTRTIRTWWQSRAREMEDQGFSPSASSRCGLRLNGGRGLVGEQVAWYFVSDVYELLVYLCTCIFMYRIICMDIYTHIYLDIYMYIHIYVYIERHMHQHVVDWT